MKKNNKVYLFALIFLFLVLQVLFSVHYINYRKANPKMIWLEDYENNDIKTGLSGHWEFDEIKNNIVKDHSKNNNNGILDSFCRFSTIHFSRSPKQVDGKRGKALKFNGQNWLSFGNKKIFCTDEFTISTWVYRFEDDKSIVPTIMAKSAWPLDGWWLCTKPHTKYIDMGIAWGSSYKHIESGYELPDNEWHHIAVSMNNNKHEISFFIDGKKYGATHKNVPVWLVNWNHELLLGGYDGSSRWGWNGLIDNTRYYNCILNENEIEDIYLSDNIKY